MGNKNPENCAIEVIYTNYRGETSKRKIIPLGKPFIGSTEYHPRPQYLMDVWDLDRKAKRTYSLKDIKEWTSFPSFD
ncbi:MAG: hypothetical protein KC506_00385 [Nanoarchaeota archaeon]|nr:hypothetical protein [Nanoarchaeota archaeon]